MAAPVAGFVQIAEVVKAVGLRGELKLYPMIDWWEDLLDTDLLVWDDGAPASVLGWRPHGPCYVAAVDGVADRDAAEARVGRSIGFLRSRYPEPGFPKPSGGLPFRWLGCEVRDTAGEVLGEVHEVRLYGPQFTLAIRRGGREVLIPAVPPILVDGAGLGAPLVVDPPEGLLDVAGD